MSVTYNIDFDVAALILLIVEMVYLRLQYSHEKYSNRLFIMLMHSAVLFAVVDISSSLMLTSYSAIFPARLIDLVTELYYLVNAFLFLVFYRYIVEFLDDKYEKTVAYYVKTYFPFIFVVECLIANHFANIVFSRGKYGHFSYGSLISLIYVYPVYYYVLTGISLIKNRKRISLRQECSVISFIVISIASIFIQYLYPEIMTMAFGYAVSLLILLFSLETPNEKSLVDKTEQIESIRERAEQLDEFNRAFIGNLTTDICAPVEKMLKKSDSIPTDSLDEVQRELNQYIEGYGKLMLSSVNNVRAYGNTQGDGRDSAVKEYSVTKMVDDVRNMMLPIFRDKSNSMVVEVSSDIPETMIGYDLIIKQVLINLISDANKYTENGTVTLMVNCRRTGHTHMNLLISVEDTGIGMNRAMVKELMSFNPKKAAWNQTVFSDGNFNVCVTKKLIEEMNGKLHIDSAPKKGSVFSAIIPQEIL